MSSPQPNPSALRIVSLLPAATEIVCALGLEGQLVGISHECDYPASVRGIPALTSSKLSTRATSQEIDLDLRDILRRALAIYDIDSAALQRAEPDVIVTQNLCEVCAIPLGEVQRAVREFLPRTKLVNLAPTRLADLWSNLDEVAAALGVSERAQPLIERLQQRLAKISQRAHSNSRASRPQVLTIESIDPLMVGGLWMPDLVEIAGGRALVTQAGEHAPTLSRAALRALSPAPDLVLFKPCGMRLEQSRMELGTMRELLAEQTWPALATGNVFLADGNAFFNRPGPRLVESAEILAALTQPDEFEDFAARHAKSYARLELG